MTLWIESRASTKAITTADAIAEFIKAKKQDGTGSRQVDVLTNHLATFLKSSPVQCIAINSGTITDYLRRMQDEREWCGLTRNHHRTSIGNFCNWARATGYLPRSWAEMDFVPVAKHHHRGLVEIFTPDQARKLLAGASESGRLVLSIGMFSGIRPSEICRLKWEDIDWERNEVHIAKQKVRTAGQRIVPMLPALRSFLEPAKAQGRLFPWRFDWATKVARDASRKSGVQWIADGARHSFVSYRLATLRDIARVSEETGTSAMTLRKHYRRPVSEATATEWFGIRFNLTRK